MGGAISNIGKALGGVVKQVAPSIIKAVAPAATKILKGITDGFISKGADMLKGLTSALPSPLKALADKLIGKGADKLKELGGGFIEKGLAKLTEMITKRFAPGAGNVSLPSLPGRIQDIVNNNVSTAAPSAPSTGSSSSAATGSSSSAGASSGASGSPNLPPNPNDAKYQPISDNAKLQQLMTDRQAYQDARQQMMDSMRFLSDIAKASSDTLNAIARNVK